jgi:acyl dehydratase|tara:strand:- start:777 stop:1295 length:519 start_codon:yes stop_codon:yes gene_type:complete
MENETKSFGNYYEDFVVGEVLKHPLGRTITESDNTWFTLMTMNTNPYHFDKEYSSQSPYGKILVNSCLTLSIVTGQSVIDLSQNAFANLGWDDIKLPHPVYVGDTLYSESKITDKRESKTRKYGGIVSVSTVGYNQNGDIVISWDRKFFVYKKDSKYAKFTRPEPDSPWDKE